jgi:hypothetical protein
MPEQRRVATLLAFARHLEVSALDDALDLLDLLIQTLLARVYKAGQREMLRTIRDLDAAALQLRNACLVLLDPTYEDAELRQAVFSRIPAEKLRKAIARYLRHSGHGCGTNWSDQATPHAGRNPIPAYRKPVRSGAY